MKKDKNIPKSLKERRGERALITVWFGIIPLFLGFYGVYRSITKPDVTKIYQNEIDIKHFYNCKQQEITDNCLRFVIKKTEDTLYTGLAFEEENRYLALVDFNNNDLNRKLDSLPYKSESLIELINRKERDKRLNLVEDYINKVEIEYLEKDVISLIKINNVEIRKYRNPIWGTITFLAIGILWIWLHVKFFLKDPYDVYKPIKDPFSKYKK